MLSKTFTAKTGSLLAEEKRNGSAKDHCPNGSCEDARGGGSGGEGAPENAAKSRCGRSSPGKPSRVGALDEEIKELM